MEKPRLVSGGGYLYFHSLVLSAFAWQSCDTNVRNVFALRGVCAGPKGVEGRMLGIK